MEEYASSQEDDPKFGGGRSGYRSRTGAQYWITLLTPVVAAPYFGMGLIRMGTTPDSSVDPFRFGSLLLSGLLAALIIRPGLLKIPRSQWFGVLGIILFATASVFLSLIIAGPLVVLGEWFGGAVLAASGEYDPTPWWGIPLIGTTVAVFTIPYVLLFQFLAIVADVLIGMVKRPRH